MGAPCSADAEVQRADLMLAQSALAARPLPPPDVKRRVQAPQRCDAVVWEIAVERDRGRTH